MKYREQTEEMMADNKEVFERVILVKKCIRKKVTIILTLQ